MSKPIIATNVAGCREVVRHNENGYLVEPQNPISLEKAIVKLVRLEEEEREKMGKIGRDMVEVYFSDEIVTTSFLDLIEEII